ncbi:MAG TPA: STAS domain-containing protein [Thermoanaerobaculia bacterium]|nr:STAS domain-containing protein [Thermoanaerobaculia bacterium]
MALNVETSGVVRVITLEGKLGTEIAQDLKTEFDAYLAGSPGPTLLDMSQVRYISSYLVGVLVDMRSRLAARGYALHFAGIDARHRLVLTISGLDELFGYHAERAEGIAALAASAKPA